MREAGTNLCWAFGPWGEYQGKNQREVCGNYPSWRMMATIPAIRLSHLKASPICAGAPNLISLNAPITSEGRATGGSVLGLLLILEPLDVPLGLLTLGSQAELLLLARFPASHRLSGLRTPLGQVSHSLGPDRSFPRPQPYHSGAQLSAMSARLSPAGRPLTCRRLSLSSSRCRAKSLASFLSCRSFIFRCQDVRRGLS